MSIHYKDNEQIVIEIKKLMLEKLAGHFGDELCTQIKFVPAGRRG